MFLIYGHDFLLQPSDHMLGKDWPLGYLVYDVSCVLTLSQMVFWVRCGT